MSGFSLAKKTSPANGAAEKRNARLFFALLLFICAILVLFSSASKSRAKERQENEFYKIAQEEGRLEVPRSASTKGKQIVQRTAYALCYNEGREQAEWAAYQLDSERLAKNAKRTDDFREDPDIKTGSAALDDYRGSGYDRGHLVPAGDMAYSAQTMSETFLLSNISPQVHAFNEGVWNSLEQHVRLLARKHERVFVATGPVFEKDAYPAIGRNKVSVPDFFYKAVLIQDGSRYSMEAYIVPASAAKEDFRLYKTSVDEIENRTGIDFFFLLDDALEEALEAQGGTYGQNF